MEYKKLFMQQQTFDGRTYTNVGTKIDTQDAYHVVCEEFPFKHLPETKDLAKREWHDEHGEDVYIPNDGLKFKAYDLEASFLYVGKQEDMQTELFSFVNFISGRNTGGSPMLAVYDEYTQTGRRGVYVQSINNDLFAYDDMNPEVIARFKVKFRVTDPMNNINADLTAV